MFIPHNTFGRSDLYRQYNDSIREYQPARRPCPPISMREGLCGLSRRSRIIGDAPSKARQRSIIETFQDQSKAGA